MFKTCALILALAIAVLDNMRVDAASASSNALQFESAPIVFNATPLDFNATPLTFPDSVICSETSATIEITLPADILFDFDKAEIRATARKALHEVADLLRANAGRPVKIQGYTDALGKDAHNQTLSQRRANSVRAWLVTREGFSGARFTSLGFGPRNPVAPNRKPDGSDDPEGRQLNRRVTLIIKK